MPRRSAIWVHFRAFSMHIMRIRSRSASEYKRPAALSQLRRFQQIFCVVELYGSNGNSAEFSQFSGRVLRHRDHILASTLHVYATSQARGNARGFLNFRWIHFFAVSQHIFFRSGLQLFCSVKNKSRFFIESSCKIIFLQYP